MSKESFWVFGIDYLEQCGAVGNGAIEMFISKMNIKTEKNALKLLNVIRGKGLNEAGTNYMFSSLFCFSLFKGETVFDTEFSIFY